MASSRALTLTEELEKLEQSITLTLQEIDHNFSRAHRIVTSSILPVVEDYAKHSEAVWEGTKFWKQFFEASANVSLSSYAQAAEEGEEDRDDDHGEGEGTTVQGQDETRQTLAQDHQRHAYEDTPRTNAGAEDTIASVQTRPVELERYDADFDDTQALGSPSLNLHLDLRKNAPNTTAPVAEYPSPYEALKREMDAAQKKQPTTTTTIPTTPGRPGNNRSKIPLHLHSTPARPESSPFRPPTRNTNSTATANADPLLHRVLDRNYRVQATPRALTKATRPMRGPQTHHQPASAVRNRNRNSMLNATNPALLDSSPFSPALPEAPRLRSEIFGSPVRRGGARQDAGGPRTPGVSVQRAVWRSGMKTRMTRDARTPGGAGAAEARGDDDDERNQVQDHTTYDDFNDLDDTEDDDDSLDFGLRGMSPPKTLQFHIPSTTYNNPLPPSSSSDDNPSNRNPDSDRNGPTHIPAPGGGKGTVLATPARLASRRIVEDLLFTAGLARGHGVSGKGGEEETSTLEGGAYGVGGSWELRFREEAGGYGEEDVRREEERQRGREDEGEGEEEHVEAEAEGAMTANETGLLRGMGHLRFRGEGDETPVRGGFADEEGGFNDGGSATDDEDDNDDGYGEMESPSVVRVARGGFGGRADDVF